ncbi:MAG: DUF1330 domain-containing protein [Bryobacteraceae bacterium]
MHAYLVVNIEVSDPTAYEEYKAGVPPILARHGGEYIVRGGSWEAFEGDWRPSRLVIIRFPSIRAIRAFMDDPEYQPLKEIRHRVAHSEMIGVEGVRDPLVP